MSVLLGFVCVQCQYLYLLHSWNLISAVKRFLIIAKLAFFFFFFCWCTQMEWHFCFIKICLSIQHEKKQNYTC